MHYTIHADGGARGNPGPAGAGALIRDELGNAVVAVSQYLGHRTNNYAEYEAAILAFEELARLVPAHERAETSVAVKMDSELVVKQVNGLYKVKHPTLKNQHARLKRAMSVFGEVSFAHVQREENRDADALANEAMDRGSTSLTTGGV